VVETVAVAVAVAVVAAAMTAAVTGAPLAATAVDDDAEEVTFAIRFDDDDDDDNVLFAGEDLLLLLVLALTSAILSALFKEDATTVPHFNAVVAVPYFLTPGESIHVRHSLSSSSLLLSSVSSSPSQWLPLL
jgi:hypothetical protein